MRTRAPWPLRPFFQPGHPARAIMAAWASVSSLASPLAALLPLYSPSSEFRGTGRVRKKCTMQRVKLHSVCGGKGTNFIRVVDGWFDLTQVNNSYRLLFNPNTLY
mmetsp:Transcript_7134/g.11208  ORF Transcript_7134/g.11208 Transcript_7134/m.11208 type:complete len:105 (+) Transcript_7134:1395-1709(+)